MGRDSRQKWVPLAQWSVRLAILLFITWQATLHITKGVVAAPSIHAFCPFGGLASLFRLVAEGSMIKKIAAGTFVLLTGTIVLAVALRRSFCGWICPLGTLGYLFSTLGRWLKLPQNKVPENLDQWMRWVKYFALVLILGWTWKASELVFSPFDPWAAYGHLPEAFLEGFSGFFDEFLVGGTLLFLATFGSLFLTMNWCRYLCPMGAFLAVVSKVSPTAIQRNLSKCISCKKCSLICPVSIDVASMHRVTSAECLQCGECIRVCPKPDTLDYQTRGRRIPPALYGIATIVLFFGTIGLAKSMNIWQMGFANAGDVLKGNSGYPDPKHIKGSLTLEHIEKEFGIPLDLLLESLNLPVDAPRDAFIKELASKNGIEVHDFRKAIRNYLVEKHPERTYEELDEYEH